MLLVYDIREGGFGTHCIFNAVYKVSNNIHSMPSCDSSSKIVGGAKKRAEAKKKVAKKLPEAAMKKLKNDVKKPRVDVKYLIVRGVVHNILDNARYVLAACQCKTVTPAHLKAVAMIQATIAKNHIGALPASVKKMKGGDPVHSSEYYGVDSGAYMDISQVSQLETHMFSDAALARVEMPIKMIGGGKKAAGDKKKDLVGAAAVKKALKDATGEPVRVNKEAREWMRVCAEEHVKEMMKHVGDAKKLKLEAVQVVVEREACFAHLRGRL